MTEQQPDPVSRLTDQSSTIDENRSQPPVAGDNRRKAFVRPLTPRDTPNLRAINVTVVVATRNRCERLRRCLQQLSQLPEQPHVIVVDNGSTDNTAAMVRIRFPSVSLIRLPRNHGAVARNVGVLLARTPVVAFADDDSAWEPGSLAAAARYMERHPRLALIAARTLVGPKRRVDDLSTAMAAAPLGHEPDLPGPSILGFLACAAVVRREAFLRAGGFDPVVFFMGEEDRLAYDLQRLGWGMAYCEDIQARHEPDVANPARALLADRNRVLTLWMRRPLSAALSATVALLGRAVTHPPAWRTAGQLLYRLPAAIARRRGPNPNVEARLRILAAVRTSPY
jgi:GT2 family glycosyltransferase